VEARMQLLGWMEIPRRNMEKAPTAGSFKTNLVRLAPGRSRAEATQRECFMEQAWARSCL